MQSLGLPTARGNRSRVPLVVSASTLRGKAAIVETRLGRVAAVGATVAEISIARVLGYKRVGALGLVVTHLLAVVALDARHCDASVSR